MQMNSTKTKDEYLNELKELCELKGFSQQTKKSYLFHVEKFLKFCEQSSFNLTPENVRRYLLSIDVSVNTSRLAHASLKFFFDDPLYFVTYVTRIHKLSEHSNS